MSTFRVEVRRIASIEIHPKADRLALAVVDSFRAVVEKGAHQADDLAVYVPEAAVCPQWVLERVKLWDAATGKGLCGGALGTRVRAVTLRGMLSQGLVWPLSRDAAGVWFFEGEQGVRHDVIENDDVAAMMGITKYFPEIPAELLGLEFDAGIDLMPRFDLEDIKGHPGLIADGEGVEYTEKMHGTQVVMVRLPDNLVDPVHGRYRLASKGMSGEGRAFQWVPENDQNAYVKAFFDLDMPAKLDAIAAEIPAAADAPLIVVGELIGGASGQDLKYGVRADIRVFDIGVGARHQIDQLDRDVVEALAVSVGAGTAPVLYRGPFSEATLQMHTAGLETVSGKALHIREGVVVRLLRERNDPAIGRVILKSINPAYILRDGGSEHN